MRGEKHCRYSAGNCSGLERNFQIHSYFLWFLTSCILKQKNCPYFKKQAFACAFGKLRKVIFLFFFTLQIQGSGLHFPIRFPQSDPQKTKGYVEYKSIVEV